MSDAVPPAGPPPPVRRAFWLATAGVLLVLAQAAGAAVVLARFDGAVAALRGSVAEEIDAIAAVRLRLVVTVVLAVAVAPLLGFAAVAVRRRSPNTRTVAGVAVLVSVVALLLGAAFGPDGAVDAQTDTQLAEFETLLPVWFSALSIVTVTGTIVLLGLALAGIGRADAVEYYREHDPTGAPRR